MKIQYIIIGLIVLLIIVVIYKKKQQEKANQDNKPAGDFITQATNYINHGTTIPDTTINNNNTQGLLTVFFKDYKAGDNVYAKMNNVYIYDSYTSLVQGKKFNKDEKIGTFVDKANYTGSFIKLNVNGEAKFVPINNTYVKRIV